METTKSENTTNRRGNGSALKRLVIRPLLWVWDGLKMPIILTCLCFFMGFGFYHGIIAGEGYTKMTHGKALIITLIDLSDADSEE